MRVAPQLPQELLNFCQGAVESFGVVLTWPQLEPAVGDKQRPLVEGETSPRVAARAGQPTSPSPPPPSTTPTGEMDTESTADKVVGAPQRPPPPRQQPAVRVSLMPSWSLIERDPKLWMLLRKSLLANLALAVLTLLYAALSHGLTSSSPRPAARPSALAQSSPAAAAAAGRALDEAATAGAVGGAATTSSSSLTSSLTFLLLFWWVRLCLCMVKYVGQWPFYTLLQVIGLVWFSQLYRETWLVRKGWVLRGTGLRETAANSSGATTTATTTTAAAPTPPAAPHGTSTSPSPASSTAGVAGVAQPWLAPIPLYPTDDGEAVRGAPAPRLRPLAVRTADALARAAPLYVRHTAHLVARLLRHKGPTAALQEWVLGDAAGAAAATAAAAASPASALGSAARAHRSRTTVNATPPVPASPDPFAAVLVQLESISEVLFKALATMSFALFASFVERLPLVGTPLCVLLNAQLYAFYVFDYRYAAQQQPDAVHQRGSALTYQLRHFEQCSMYYAGYGIGSAALALYLTHHLGTVVSVCAMSVVYSWQVVWSGFAVPLPSSRPVPLFSVWFHAVDMTQRHYAVLWRLAAVAVLLYLPAACVRSWLGYGA